MQFTELFDDGNRQVLLGDGRHQVVLTIHDQGVLQFSVPGFILRSLERGVDVQLSRGETYCLLRSDGRMVAIDYSRPKGGRGRISISELTFLMAMSE